MTKKNNIREDLYGNQKLMGLIIDNVAKFDISQIIIYQFSL